MTAQPPYNLVMETPDTPHEDSAQCGGCLGLCDLSPHHNTSSTALRSLLSVVLSKGGDIEESRPFPCFMHTLSWHVVMEGDEDFQMGTVITVIKNHHSSSILLKLLSPPPRLHTLIFTSMLMCIQEPSLNMLVRVAERRVRGRMSAGSLTCCPEELLCPLFICC